MSLPVSEIAAVGGYVARQVMCRLLNVARCDDISHFKTASDSLRVNASQFYSQNVASLRIHPGGPGSRTTKAQITNKPPLAVDPGG